jgi:hypothetical protein
MSTSDRYVPTSIFRRLDAIEARLEAAIRRARVLAQKNAEEEPPKDRAVRCLEEIESSLDELEHRLKRIEEDTREKESPPETFGSEHGFSTGMHFPGLG